jgi:putative addiction module component (TIGR02574 family)
MVMGNEENRPSEDQPTAEEKELLDRELEEYRRNPKSGSSWEEVKARLRSAGGTDGN